MTLRMFWLGGKDWAVPRLWIPALIAECSFYSDAVLGGLHRAMAIGEWVKLRDGHPVPLERALAAFDTLCCTTGKATLMR